MAAYLFTLFKGDIMLNKVTNDQFNGAVVELSNLIIDQKAKFLFDGWRYYLTASAPESFKKLKEFEADQLIPIANYGCETSIYSFYVNCDFRFWHDVLHLTHNLDFSYNGETKVNALHMRELDKAGVSALAKQIFWADTQGQTEYYKKHKKFVVNQSAFVWSVIHHGIMNALSCEH